MPENTVPDQIAPTRGRQRFNGNWQKPLSAIVTTMSLFTAWEKTIGRQLRNIRVRRLKSFDTLEEVCHLARSR